MSRKTPRFAVTAPTLDQAAPYDDLGPALSRAITEAGKRANVTAYVRNADGVTYGYAESDDKRHVIVVRT